MRNINEYHRPKQLDEALSLLARRGVATVPIGGGSALIAEARPDVEAVVDLRDLNLTYVRRDGDTLRVGATTTLQALIDSPESAQAWGGELARAAALTAARNLREQGTLAGMLVSAAHNNPLAVMLLAVGAAMTLLTPDSQTVSLDKFFTQRTALFPGALITEIAIPLPRPGEAVAFEKVSRTPADLPIVCVAVKTRIDIRIARDVRIGLGSVGAAPMRATRSEQALEGQSLDRRLIDVAAKTIGEEVDPPSDFMGSAEYRREMATVLARRALTKVMETARG